MGKGRGVSPPWRSVEREIEADEVDEKSPLEGPCLLLEVISVGRDKGGCREMKKDWYSSLGLLDNQLDIATGTSEPPKAQPG